VELIKRCSNPDCNCEYILDTENDDLVKFYCCSNNCNEKLFSDTKCGVLPDKFKDAFYNTYHERYKFSNNANMIIDWI